MSDLRCPNPDAMCSGLELELCWLTDLRCDNARFVCWLVLQRWLRCSVDVFVFKFALVISDLVICSVYWVLASFFFFLVSVGLLYLFTICWVFFCLDWVCFTFRIDVWAFLWACSVTNFFFFQILVQNFFGLFFFF